MKLPGLDSLGGIGKLLDPGAIVKDVVVKDAVFLVISFRPT